MYLCPNSARNVIYLRYTLITQYEQLVRQFWQRTCMDLLRLVQSLTTYQRVDTEDKIKMGRTLSENLVQEPKLKQQAIIPSTATLALPSIDIENIHPGTIIQDLVPVNSGNRPVIVSNPSTCNTFMDHLQDIDIGDILGELSSNAPLPIQNRQTHMQSKPQIFYGNFTVIHNLTINK